MVNGAESEPGSAKDSALLLVAPHLVLDGAESVARAIGARRIHVVVSGSRPPVEAAVTRAIAQRDTEIAWSVAATTGGFVGGHSSAVLELVAGRANRPVTRWAPAAQGSRRQRATLLSNAETFAQTAALSALGAEGYGALGTTDEPGTTLVSIGGDGIVDTSATTIVGEVPHGVSLEDVLGRRQPPVAVLVGGYHGTWVPWHAATSVLITRRPGRGGPPILGPGVLLPLAAGRCPIQVSAEVLTFLAAARIGQCGPCASGLPELAAVTTALSRAGRSRSAPLGHPPAAAAAGDAGDQVSTLASLINGRGACAHPDGAARLAYSLVAVFADEVEAHTRGRCLT